MRSSRKAPKTSTIHCQQNVARSVAFSAATAEQASKNFWTFAHFCAFVLVVLFALACRPAKAFMVSEDQQFQADIDEAKARSKDFKRTMERIDSDEKEIEAAGKGQGELRVREATEQERLRRDYVRERNNLPSAELALERLEREDDKLKERDVKAMEANRREYVQKRDRVRHVLERDAYIDEKLEYGL
jgi:hypothetical protein